VNGRNAETMQCADWMVRLDFVAVVELEAPFLADATVEGHPLVEVAHLWRSRSGRALVENEELVQHAEDCKSNNESEDGNKEPVLGEPEDDLDIGPVPAVSKVMGEETPGVVVVFLWEEDAHAVLVDGTGVVVMSPHKTEEERSGGGHDGDVGERPATVVVGQGVDGLEEERVTRDRTHGIVRDTSGNGAANPSWVGKKRVETAVASIVQVNVDSTKVVEDKVANSIGALDGVGVAVESLEEPWVFLSDKLARLLVGPQLVLVVGVEVQAALLGALPVQRYTVVDVRLVDDLGDQLRRITNRARVGRREFSAENGILAASRNQKTEQCPYAVYREAEDDDGDEQEYGDASPHGCCIVLCLLSRWIVVHGLGGE